MSLWVAGDSPADIDLDISKERTHSDQETRPVENESVSEADILTQPLSQVSLTYEDNDDGEIWIE